jgi:hypothetical protein
MHAAEYVPKYQGNVSPESVVKFDPANLSQFKVSGKRLYANSISLPEILILWSFNNDAVVNK